MTETTHFITIARGPRAAEFACQRCGERITTGPDVWVPDHKCPRADQ